MNRPSQKLTQEHIKTLSSIIEKELFAFSFDANHESYSVYVNKFGHKKLVFDTMVSSLGFKDYIESVSMQALKLITDRGFSANVDVFCTNSIDSKTIDSLYHNVLDSKGIQLTIFDLTAIKTCESDKVKDYLTSIWEPDRTNEQQYAGTEKALFDILASGKDTTDIKNNLIYSVIVLSIFKAGNRVLIDELKKSVFAQLEKDVSNFDVILQQMAQMQIIKYDPISKKHVKLFDDSTYNDVERIVEKAKIIETEFMERFHEILANYNVSNEDGIFDSLKVLYQQHFSLNSTEEYDKRADTAYQDLEILIKSHINDSRNVTHVINEIKKLCEENPYLDSISATSSFIGMYRSNQLDEYINKKQKCVVLDTPLLVYLLCNSSMKLPPLIDWQQPQYKATIELYNLYKKKPNDVLLYTMDDYLKEVVGEYKKALQMGWLETMTNVGFLKTANNTFYNYYRYVVDNPEIFDDLDKVNNFDDFAKEILAFHNVCIDSNSFYSDSIRDLKNYLLKFGMGLRLVSFRSKYDGEIDKITKEYQGTLKHSKSDLACEADAKALVYLSRIKRMPEANYSRDVELYISTWDRTFDKYRLKLFNSSDSNRFFITTPAKLVNKIALANFNINDTCISNDVFLFADTNFGVREKVVNFVNKVAPIYGPTRKTNKFLNAVIEWYQEQVENDTNNETRETDTYSFTESFVLVLFEKINSCLNSTQIEKLKSDITIDKDIRKVFLNYKKVYTSEEEVDKSSSEMVERMKIIIDNVIIESNEAVIE